MITDKKKIPKLSSHGSGDETGGDERSFGVCKIVGPRCIHIKALAGQI